MGKVIFNMTMSLDGFVAGLNDGPANPLGDGGGVLFRWYEQGDTEVPIMDGTMVLKVSATSARLIRESLEKAGASVWGRKTFDITGGWGGHPPIEPCIIMTHQVPQEWVKDGSPFIFITGGIENAIRQAKKAAGDKDVVVSTASVLQQCLQAGLMDEIYVDVAPVLLGAGVRLFDRLGSKPIELERIRAIEAEGVTHLGFKVVKK